jgi:hypothetical protein
VVIIRRGNCCLLLLLMCQIYKSSWCAYVSVTCVNFLLEFMYAKFLMCHVITYLIWVVPSLVVLCAASLGLECIQVLSMRMRVCVGGLCPLLLCFVLRLLFSNACWVGLVLPFIMCLSRNLLFNSPWNRVLEKPSVENCSRISQHVMEPEGLLPFAQEPSTGPYYEPDLSSP